MSDYYEQYRQCEMERTELKAIVKNLVKELRNERLLTDSLIESHEAIYVSFWDSPMGERATETQSKRKVILGEE